MTRPVISLTTLPKSGTMYIGTTLARWFGFDRAIHLSDGAFPDTEISLDRVNAILAGDRPVGQDHYPATDVNLQRLRLIGPG